MIHYRLNKGYILGQHNEYAAPFSVLSASPETDFREALRGGKE